jgi:hypothetical protein
MAAMVTRALPILGLLLAACAGTQDRSVSLFTGLQPLLERPEGPLLRYNPADCDCPRFELQGPHGWVRARLQQDPENPVVDRLIKQGEEALAQGRPALFQIPAELASRSPQYCASGVPFVELELSGDWPADPSPQPLPGEPPEATP